MVFPQKSSDKKTRQGTGTPKMCNIAPMNSENRESPLFLTIPEAAEQIGVDPRTLHAAIDAGQLTARKIGSRLLISRRAIERLVEAE
jgi:excisionase family DNA binding protein